jgi:prepilin peptidase CpaA
MLIRELALVLLVTAASLLDLRRGKIPNALTYPACLFGLGLAAADGGWSGLTGSLLGLAVGFLPFFALYLLGGLGGGDVKLMAAVGALMGYPFILNALVTSVLVGGLIALLLVIWEGKLWQAIRFLGLTVGRVFIPGLQREPLSARQNVPFGVAICLGSFLTLLCVWRGYASPAQLLASL